MLKHHYCAIPPDEWFCFVFNYLNGKSTPWCPNAELRLVGESCLSTHLRLKELAVKLRDVNPAQEQHVTLRPDCQALQSLLQSLHIQV